MKIAAWAAASAGILLLALAAVCGGIALALGNRPMPNALRIQPSGPRHSPSPYRVAVLGDSQKGLQNLANLLREVQARDVSFILHTGDLVSNNDEGHYRLAALYLERANLRVPMTVLPGNHDVKGGTERFTVEIGPLTWIHPRGEVLFVGLDNALGHPPDLKVLDEILTGASHPEVVLAMHVPPFDVTGKTLPGYEPFVEWLSKSRVRYLFCGQIHDYVRKQIGQTIVIANGVGGDYESWQLKQKVYATILEVDGGKLTDRAIEIPPEHGIVENLEHLAIGHVAEAFRQRPWLLWPALAVLIALVILAVRVARLKPRPVS